MEYVKRYNLIVDAMYHFEKEGYHFYRTLSHETYLSSMSELFGQITEEKARELDIFEGMLSVSSFLLSDMRDANYNTSEIENWLSENIPNLYTPHAFKRLSQMDDPLKALSVVTGIEKTVMRFYKQLMKRMPMNLGQVDSLIKRQKRLLSCLHAIKDEHEEEMVLTAACEEPSVI